MSDEHTKRAREVFMELSTLDASAVQGELDRLVGPDRELREAVIRLLDARADADHAGFMSAPTAELRGGTITESAGSVIGPYKVLQSIGEGGFGTVFLAEQARPVRRRVALKIIKLGMDTQQVIARFEAERQALALMDHPHIARVYDAGSTETGRPFFVMEYVVGDAITTFADAYKLDIPSRLALFAQVCSAVQHAHTKGIIHRDLKPANVLVSMVDGKPFAKVIDFGIAKATAAPLTDKTLFTEHRQLIGTPEYMSPEQAEGSPDIDTRTDVYALGVLLYELLTGQTPFDGARLRSAAWAEMQRIIREEDPPAPSLRLSRDLSVLASTAAARGVEPARLSTAVRGELDWVVMKALEKERSRRYDTPAQFAEDVGRHLRGEPVAAAPPSRSYRLRKFIRRNKGPVIAGGAVAAALVLGLSGTAWGWTKAQSANRSLEADRLQAIASIEKAVQSIMQHENLELDASPRLPTDPDYILQPTWSSTLQDGSWVDAGFRLDKRHHLDGTQIPLDNDEVLPALAAYLASSLSFAIEVNSTLREQYEISESRAKELAAVLVTFNGMLLSVQSDGGASVTVKQMLDSHESKVRALDESHPTAAARFRQSLSLAYLGLDEYQSSLDQARAAIDLLCARSGGSPIPDRDRIECYAARLHAMSVQERLGIDRYENKSYEEGRPLIAEAIRLCEELIAEVSADPAAQDLLPYILYRYARMITNDRQDEAIGVFRRVAEMPSPNPDFDVPEILRAGLAETDIRLSALSRIGQSLYFAGRHREAEVEYARMLAVVCEQYGIVSVQFSRQARFTAWFYDRLGRAELALRYADLSIRTGRQVFGDYSEEMAKTYAIASRAAASLSRFDDACWLNAAGLAQGLYLQGSENLYTKQSRANLKDLADKAGFAERFSGVFAALDAGRTEDAIGMLNASLEARFGTRFILGSVSGMPPSPAGEPGALEQLELEVLQATKPSQER